MKNNTLTHIAFDYTKFPAQCAAGILYDIKVFDEILAIQHIRMNTYLNITKINNLSSKLYNLCSTEENNVLYITHYDNRILQYFVDAGCIAIDSNFNNNSGNAFIMLKYVHEK